MDQPKWYPGEGNMQYISFHLLLLERSKRWHMRKISLLLISVCIISFVCGQQKTRNLGLGVSPWGDQEIGVRYKTPSENEKMKIKYSSYLAAHLAYETQHKGRGTLIEFGYAQSELKASIRIWSVNTSPPLNMMER